MLSLMVPRWPRFCDGGEGGDGVGQLLLLLLLLLLPLLRVLLPHRPASSPPLMHTCSCISRASQHPHNTPCCQFVSTAPQTCATLAGEAGTRTNHCAASTGRCEPPLEGRVSYPPYVTASGVFSCRASRHSRGCGATQPWAESGRAPFRCQHERSAA